MGLFYYDYSNDQLRTSDTVVVWDISSELNEPTKTLYSDRLYQWNPEKYDQLCKQVWGNAGQYFHNRSPEEIEEFLSLYLDESVKLLKITQDTNRSDGYPYWRFDYTVKESLS